MADSCGAFLGIAGGLSRAARDTIKGRLQGGSAGHPVAYRLGSFMQQGYLSEAAAPTHAERFLSTIVQIYMEQDSFRSVPITQKCGALEPWGAPLLVAPADRRFLPSRSRLPAVR